MRSKRDRWSLARSTENAVFDRVFPIFRPTVIGHPNPPSSVGIGSMIAVWNPNYEYPRMSKWYWIFPLRLDAGAHQPQDTSSRMKS